MSRRARSQGHRADGLEVDEFYKGAGCRHCRNTGYRGRMGIHELVTFDEDEMRDAITSGANVLQLRNLARSAGMPPLSHDGFCKVREGITTVEEVLHACGEV